MKKILCALLVTVLALSVVACTGRQNNVASNPNSSSNISSSQISEQVGSSSSQTENSSDSSVVVESSSIQIVSSSSESKVPSSSVISSSSIESSTPSSSESFSSSSVVSSSSITPSSSSSQVSSSSVAQVYSVSVTSAIGGTISATPTSGSSGTTITLSSTAETGYQLDYYTVDGVKISGNTFTLTKNVTVSAVFSKVQYTITINNVEGGTVTANVSSATMGTQVTLTVSCNDHYSLKSLKVNGQDVLNEKSFTMPACNVTITVEYSYTAHWTPEA